MDKPLVMAKMYWKRLFTVGHQDLRLSIVQLEVSCLEGMELNYQDFDSVLCAYFQNSFLGLFRFLLILSLGIREARGTNPLHVVSWRLFMILILIQHKGVSPVSSTLLEFSSDFQYSRAGWVLHPLL